MVVITVKWINTNFLYALGFTFVFLLMGFVVALIYSFLGSSKGMPLYKVLNLSSYIAAGLMAAVALLPPYLNKTITTSSSQTPFEYSPPNAEALTKQDSETIKPVWTLIDGSEGSFRMYADFGSLRRDGDFVTVWEYMTAPNTTSIKMQNKYDCRNERSTMLYGIVFTGEDLSGNVKETKEGDGHWIPLAPGSTGGNEMRLFCNR